MRIDDIKEFLLNYLPSRRLDTWRYLGSNKAEPSTPVYHAGLIYRIDTEDSPVKGYFVLCTETVNTQIDWTMYDYSNGNLQRVDTLHVPSEFVVILTKDERENINVPPDPDFVPFMGQLEFEDDGEPTDGKPQIFMPEYELQLILREAGVPFVTWDELEYDLSTIKTLVVYPALEHFYKFFPIIRHETIPVGNQGKFHKEYPDSDDFITVRHIFGTNASDQAEHSGMGTPFQYYRDQMIGGMFMGGYAFGRPRGRAGMNGRTGPMHFNYDDIITNLHHTATYNSMLNRYSRVKYTMNEDGVSGYHTASRFVTIEWGFMSKEWSKIPHERKLEVRELATAYALRTFGMLRQQTPENSPGRVDYSDWLSRADAVEEKILNHWHEFTKAALVRSR